VFGTQALSPFPISVSIIGTVIAQSSCHSPHTDLTVLHTRGKPYQI
jgi:hypothetical protein